MDVCSREGFLSRSLIHTIDWSTPTMPRPQLIHNLTTAAIARKESTVRRIHYESRRRDQKLFFLLRFQELVVLCFFYVLGEEGVVEHFQGIGISIQIRGMVFQSVIRFSSEKN
jgi:hypothetical protein